MDRRTIEGVEACRPRSEDLRDPELADVARSLEHDPLARQHCERVGQWDTAIHDAMEQVAVPEGLAERIMARLESASASRSSSAMAEALTATSAGDAIVQPAVAQPVARTLSRRAWIGTAAAAAATVLVAVLLGEWLRAPVQNSLDVVASEWFDELENAPGAWQNDAVPPARFAVPEYITATVVGWQRIDRFVHRQCVAYKLSHPNAGNAILFVARLSTDGLPTTAPLRPQSSTGGRSIGYWKSGALVYMLVVNGKGNDERYRAFINTKPTPLA